MLQVVIDLNKKALFYIVLASALWGTSGLFIHVMKPLGFSSMQMTAIRGVVSALCMHGYVLLRDRSLYKADWKELLTFFCSGICMFLTAYFYYSSVVASSVSTGVILMYTAPVYVTAFSVTFLGEKLNLGKVISVVLMIVGCALVSGIIGGMVLSAAGILFGVAAGISYAAYNIFTKVEMMHKSCSVTATLYAFTVMAIMGTLFANPAEIASVAASQPSAAIPLMVGIGVFTCVLPYFLYTLSLRDIPAGTASALAILEPMAATVFSILFLDERLSVASGFGIILILIAVLLLSKGDKTGTA